MLKIKVVGLEKLRNFVIYNFFICHVVNKKLSLNQSNLKFTKNFLPRATHGKPFAESILTFAEWIRRTTFCWFQVVCHNILLVPVVCDEQFIAMV
jgi:hypothetical protein